LLGGSVAGYKLKPFCDLAKWEPQGLQAYQEAHTASVL
jgi:hypothetical protein